MFALVMPSINRGNRERIILEDPKIRETKEWIKIWQQAGDALESIRLQELRSANYYAKNQSLLNEMLQYAFDHRTVRFSSGLIEQQKYL
jgi:hypothetical protein